MVKIHRFSKVYPGLRRNIVVTSAIRLWRSEALQVWCTNITYLPVLKEPFYLMEIMDWLSRKVLAWRHPGRGRCHDNIFIELLWRWRSLWRIDRVQVDSPQCV